MSRLQLGRVAGAWLGAHLAAGAPVEPRQQLTAHDEPAAWDTWTDELSDGTLARLDDAALRELGEQRAVLELQLAADRSSAELAAVKRRLAADYARERTRLQAEARARNTTRDEQAAARAAAVPARPVQPSPTRATMASSGSFLAWVVDRMFAGVLALVVLLGAISIVFGADAGSDAARQMGEVMGAGVGGTLAGLGELAEGLREGREVGGR